MPNYGYTNRGCNCTTPCARASKYGGTACEVDPLCPLSYPSPASSSGWFDFCDTPTSKQPASAVVLSYCDINFFRPECQNASASVPIAQDVKTLGALLAVQGSNYTFTFLDVTFAKTISAGGSGKTSSGRSAGGSDPNSGILASVDPARIIGNLPLLGALASTVAIVSTFALASVALSLLGVALAVVSTSRRKKTSLAEAVKSTKRSDKKVPPTYSTPLSLSLQGCNARFKGNELVLDGSTYSIRAQEALFERFNLTFSLLEAHESILPKHLVLAEADGVFGPEVPGLLFILPFFWVNEKEFKEIRKDLVKAKKKLSPRSVEEGYCRRLKRWIKACERYRKESLEDAGTDSFVLDHRQKNPSEWEHFAWEGAFETAKGRSRSDSQVALRVENPLRGSRSPRK